MRFSHDRLRIADRALSGFIERAELAGTVSLIAQHGEIVHLQALGAAQVQPLRAMRTDTLFRIFSMTKPVTSVALMMLLEEGRVRLNDPVAKYLPGLADMPVYVSGQGATVTTRRPARPMTVHDLLTHTSGLVYDYQGNDGVHGLYKRLGLLPTAYWFGLPGQRPDRIHDREEFLARVAAAALAHDPGLRFSYGISTDVLGVLIETIAGASLAEFFAARIFEPLGMSDTAFHVPPHKLDRFAASYVRGADGRMQLQDDSFAPGPFTSVPQFMSGGCGLVATAADYWRFLQMLLNRGELQGVRLLSPASVAMMTTDRLGGQPGVAEMFAELTTGLGARSLGYGLGFAVVDEPRFLSVPSSKGEYFWGGAASTMFWVEPQRQIIGIFLTQMVPTETYPLRSLFKTLTYQALIP